jgi:hypothetical protein
VVFSGHIQARRLDTRALGIAAVLMKPADLDDLCDLIRAVLN